MRQRRTIRTDVAPVPFGRIAKTNAPRPRSQIVSGYNSADDCNTRSLGREPDAGGAPARAGEPTEMLNPHARHPASPMALLRSLRQNSSLIRQMAHREAVGRYQGSVLGLAWAFFHPLLMLLVYTVVFSFIFRARWGVEETETRADFALILFVGMIVHALFAEVLNRAPGLILGNSNYVRRVVFPLEILVPVSLLSALVHAGISIAVLLLALLTLRGSVPITVLLLPIVLFPLVLMTLGVGWVLAALGVYIRDIGQMVGILTTVLLFMSPMFYPISAVPESFRPVIRANPLTLIMEQARAVLIWGRQPDFSALAIYLAVAMAVCMAGFWCFQRIRKGFADVL
jgi:lipopolysaccharide transport system permease protein